MIPPAGTVYVTLLAVSAVLTAVLGTYAFRHRQEPGATPFVLLMGALTVWSGGYAVALLTTDPAWRLFWERVQWFGTETIHLWLLLFALEYTGHDEFVDRRTVSLLLVVPSVTLLLVWTNPLHGLMWADPRIIPVDGFAVLDLTYRPAFWLNAIYAYSIIAISAGLLLRLAFLSDYLYTDQSALLVVGIATPFVVNVVDIMIFSPGPTIDYTPYAFVASGLAFGYALFRRRLFDLVPATRQLGRNTAINQLDAGILIVDNDRRTVYCNDAAADVLDADPADVLGREPESLVDSSEIAFDAEDALAEFERDGRIYEIRSSQITDRNDRRIGNTLVVHDVTVRKERERRLADQRDELARLDDLNAVIRGVNGLLVSATSRDRIERALCEKVAASDLYRTACVADIATWTGDADRWVTAGAGDPAPPEPGDERLDEGVIEDATSGSLPAVPGGDGNDGIWTVVPLVYERTVYGALALYTDREEVGERERAILGELGETVGHAINAVETRRLLSAEAVVELELESEDPSAPLVAASEATGCRLDVTGLVPGRDREHVAYVRAETDDADGVREALGSAAVGDVRTIRTGEDRPDGGCVLEWQATGDSLLGSLARRGTSVGRADAEDGTARYRLAVASDGGVRTVVDAVRGRFPDTRVVAKRERARPVDRPDALAGEGLEDLTDRQREALETAYRAGYFNWPRDSTAEEVADSLDISSPTLHSHLRKAQDTLLTDLFDPDPGPGPDFPGD